MKIKGRVSQIIEKKDYKKYGLNINELYNDTSKNFFVVLIRDDVPKNIFKNLFWRIGKKRKDWFFPCALNTFNSKENDIIEVEVEHYYVKTETYFEK